MILCKVCKEKEGVYMEEIYFQEQGLWCEYCYEKHLNRSENGVHYCCQDFKRNGEYIHYNIPLHGR